MPNPNYSIYIYVQIITTFLLYFTFFSHKPSTVVGTAVILKVMKDSFTSYTIQLTHTHKENNNKN